MASSTRQCLLLLFWGTEKHDNVVFCITDDRIDVLSAFGFCFVACCDANQRLDRDCPESVFLIRSCLRSLSILHHMLITLASISTSFLYTTSFPIWSFSVLRLCTCNLNFLSSFLGPQSFSLGFFSNLRPSASWLPRVFSFLFSSSLHPLVGFNRPASNQLLAAAFGSASTSTCSIYLHLLQASSRMPLDLRLAALVSLTCHWNCGRWCTT